MATSSARDVRTTTDSPSTLLPVSAHWECADCHSYNPSARRACKACRRLRQDLLDQCLKDSKPESTSVEPKPTRIATNHIESNSFKTRKTKPTPNWYCVICSHHNCNNDSAPTCADCGSIFMTNIEYLNFVHEQEKEFLRYQEVSKGFQEYSKIVNEDLRQQATNADYAHVVTTRELLLDTQRLSKYIQEGDENAAAQLATQFASQNIRLQAKAFRKENDEASFAIQVQLDGDEYGIDQNGGKFPIDVFRFTKVRELRAAFEFAYQYPPSNQYLFVNGCLAHDDSTMKDLNVGPNSLFILFVLSYPRTFNRTGPWTCSACNTRNNQHQQRCLTCTAKPTD
ncbi:unnamed protein product [Rotaria magnacalcarata]|uniref:Uncharacterized protein n=1 Tax=Rotaria magnacalcarata TaxID=392030 RepID=A0A815E226_9BILA|nr:unnamed protein product [Rotaria magnacalcarata]